MESMRRSEANSSHHPNKVAVNNLATESNKQTSGSGPLNNKLSFNQQQQQSNLVQVQHGQSQQKSSSSSSIGSSSSSSTTSSFSSSGASTSSESKDTNFEYDDNEWDVGGIGDLIIDLDADIEKSSSTAASSNLPQQPQQQTSDQQQQQLSNSLSATISGIGSLSIAKVDSGSVCSSGNSQGQLNAGEKSPDSSSSSSSSSSSPTTVSSTRSSLSSLFTPISLCQTTNLQKQNSSATSTTSIQSSSGKQNSKQNLKNQQNLKLQQPSLVAQLNSKLPPSDHQKLVTFSSSSRTVQSNNSISSHTLQADRHSKLLSTSVSMSSQPSGGQGAGKSATKMSIDHQATLDKGLKMKIKRTKPGTKTSEAKHEIVKAEQNGTASNLEDNITCNSSTGKKHNQTSAAPTVQPIQAQQGTKRGSSSHRRDKTRDKTPHSRDKSDHSNTSSGSNSSNNSSSSSSHSNNSSNDRSSSTSCNCSHELQVNGGIQTSCTNISCIRNRTSGLDQSNTSLTQRIPGSGGNQTNSSAAALSVNTPSPASMSNNSSSGVSSTGIFPSNNSSGNVQTSSSGTPNAPGPPKDSKGQTLSTAHHQQSSSQVSNTSSLSNIQQQQQQQGQVNMSSSPAVHNNSNQNNSNCKISGANNSQVTSISATIHHTISVTNNSNMTTRIGNCDEDNASPPAKRPKCDPKDMVDICVGTSVGTITEPDCLGPCEPGTSVTLEGIVWHETEGGVLVVNVTWRGKTYVGTLLDCTRHDWAPPRFCDSPTEELDSRIPKGRGKRGRSAALTPDLSNFTETRSSVHSKLRNGGAKGRGGRGVTTANSTSTTTTSTTTTAVSTSTSNTTNTTSSNTPSTSPTAFLPPRPEKRKSKDESPSPVNGESTQSSQTQSLVNPVTGLNVQISNKKCKTASPCAISPVLLECPEQDCSKKYKHANGLRYHQSHAHGSGSMDEDSLQLPESPPRNIPPTTPSPAPAPASTPQPQVSISTTTTVANLNSNNGANQGISQPSLPATPVPSSAPLPLTSTSAQSCVVSVSTGSGLLTTVQTSTAPQTTQSQPQQAQMPQHTVPGGSITAGISGQALSQHQQQQQQQQQHSILVGSVPGSQMMSNNNQIMPEAGQTAVVSQQPSNQQQQQQQQQPSHIGGAGITTTPTRSEPPSKIKPGVLRFGPPSDNIPGGQSSLSGQSPLRPTPTAAMAPNAGPPSTPESAHQPTYSQPPPSQQGIPGNKPQNYGKQKKNRKSPLPGDFENSTSRDDVQSPAYSDISDDSTPVVDSEINDKTQPVKHVDVKKVPEGAPPQMAPLSGYGMYQFYSQQPYLVPPEHQPSKPPPSQSSLPPSSPAEYNKNKEPPLDLMTKSAQSNDPSGVKEANVSTSTGPGAPPPNKPMSHFYPYNYMPQGYSYNLDPNYGPVSMVSDENKLGSVQNPTPSMKEERTKESPSPHEHGKLSGQMIPTKLIKNEQSSKDMKVESTSHPLHPKEPSMQSLGAYPGLYQRHSMGVPSQPQQHMSREDDLRRYYLYPDQRRSSAPGSSAQSNVPPGSVKEESPSPSQSSIQHPSAVSISQSQQISQISSSVQSQSQQQQQQQSQSSSQQQQQQQKSVKTNISSSQSSSGQKATNLIKDSKEDKEPPKIKQEGQKPTMETQGPPPPPTSQYFLHPSYISPGPFGFDPGHPMYRNVLMSTGPYNTPPYHLPMARFHAPEDLSRNPGTKALDALHHAASQYYNSHKIHELSERALKSPTSSNVKVSVSSPNVSQQSGPNSGSGSNGGPTGGPGILPSSGSSSGPLNLQPQSGSIPPGMGAGGVSLSGQKGDNKSGNDPSGKGGGIGSGVVGGSGATDSRSPPPQRHVHTHHHTHVGLGYPMYPAPYGAAVLASQQAAAVAVINPFPPGPTK